MTETEYDEKLEELDRQLNDPDIPMDPARVWALLADLDEHASGLTGTVASWSGRGPSRHAEGLSGRDYSGAGVDVARSQGRSRRRCPPAGWQTPGRPWL